MGEWEQTIDVTYRGVPFAIRAVLPDKARRRDGHNVNVGSVAGRLAFAGGAVYSAIKLAVRAIPDCLRREAPEYEVRVTDIEPGAVATERVGTIRPEGTRQAVTREGAFYASGATTLRDVDVANAILDAVSQPAHVIVSELMIRPAMQAFSTNPETTEHSHGPSEIRRARVR